MSKMDSDEFYPYTVACFKDDISKDPFAKYRFIFGIEDLKTLGKEHMEAQRATL